MPQKLIVLPRVCYGSEMRHLPRIVPEGQTELMQLTARIVGAYISENRIPAPKLPEVIATVSASLNMLLRAGAQLEDAREKHVLEEGKAPAADRNKSVFDEYIICLECGQEFISLKRHISKAHGLSPDEYRKRWQLARKYPMSAPHYSARRTEIARSQGLGQIYWKKIVRE